MNVVLEQYLRETMSWVCPFNRERCTDVMRSCCQRFNSLCTMSFFLQQVRSVHLKNSLGTLNWDWILIRGVCIRYLYKHPFSWFTLFLDCFEVYLCERGTEVVMYASRWNDKCGNIVKTEIMKIIFRWLEYVLLLSHVCNSLMLCSNSCLQLQTGSR